MRKNEKQLNICLNEQGIDTASETAQKWMNEAGVAHDDVLRIRLALEELLEQLKVGYHTPITVECDFTEDVEILEGFVDVSYLTNLGFGRHEISICFWNGYAPGYFYIMEADGSPPTGDTANFPLWGSMMLLSAMGMMAAAGIILKRKKNEE